MSLRENQCKKVCRILDDVLANRPTERDLLIVAVRKAFESLEQFGNSEPLPSAQPEPQWIPWNSGNLPEESGTYAVTAYDGAIKRVTYAKYQKRLKRWELTGARAYWRVLAWMPLPEPWEGGQE